MTQTFDPHAYEEQLARGLKLSGESAEYFSTERIHHVVDVCRGRALAPRKILEWGCGLGANLRLLGDAFPKSELCGVDVSREMLAAAQREFDGRATFLHVNTCSMEREFDLVFVNGVFHHIPPSDRQGIMNHIHRVLVPGALLAVFDNNPLNPGAMWVMKRIEFDRDAQPLTSCSMQRLVRGAGFTDLNVRYHFYFPRALKGLRWSEPWLARVPLGAQYVVWASRESDAPVHSSLGS